MVSAPDPLSAGFTADTATATTVSLTYTVTGSGGIPASVALYFAGEGGTPTSTQVITTGTGAPDGVALINSGGIYTDLTATLTIDVSNCLLYTKLCAAIQYASGKEDDNPDNNVICTLFGGGSGTAGTKTCPGK